MRIGEETIETLYAKLKDGGSDISLKRLRKIRDLQNMLAENEITKEEYWARIEQVDKENYEKL